MSADVDVKQLKDRLLKMLQVWGPTMKRLQDEVPAGELLALEADVHPAGDTAQAALEKDVREAAGGFRSGLEPTGEAAKIHRLEDYESVEEWAAVVMELLTEDHKAACTEVYLKQVDEVPCSITSCKGCRRCVFWMAVRYWRNVETGGKATEAYDSKTCSLARLKGRVGSRVDLQ